MIPWIFSPAIITEDTNLNLIWPTKIVLCVKIPISCMFSSVEYFLSSKLQCFAIYILVLLLSVTSVTGSRVEKFCEHIFVGDGKRNREELVYYD